MNSNPSVVIITPWYGEFAGGAEVAARNYAEQISSIGIDVSVLTTCCKSPYDNWWSDFYKPGQYVINGVSVNRFPVNTQGRELYEKAVVKTINNSSLDIEDRYNFFRYGINSDSLIKYVEQLPSSVSKVALPYFQGLTFSVVTELPEKIYLLPCFHNEDQFYWEPVKDMLYSSKGLLYLSDEEKDMVIKQYGNTVGKKVVEGEIVGIGIENTDKFILSNMLCKTTDNRSDKDILKMYKIPSEYYIYVGRKESGKGVPELVKWYQQFSKNKDIPLVFIGGGDDSLIPDGNCFINLGFIQKEDKDDLIKNSIGLINLSRNESFSLVIMEAWLNHVPVIVSSFCEVTKGHCRRSNGGFFVAAKNDFCKALEMLCDDRKMRNKLGDQGFLYVNDKYNWSTVLYRFLDAII